MEAQTQNLTEAQQRAAVVAEAKTWLGTPYHHMARVKGCGVDCSMLLAEAYAACGLIPHLKIAHYPPDWHLHRGEERYINEVDLHAVELPAGEMPLPGDMVVFQFGRTFSHGGIVVEWPMIIHSYLKVGVVLEDYSKAEWLQFVGENTTERGKPRPLKFYRLKTWAKEGAA